MKNLKALKKLLKVYIIEEIGIDLELDEVIEYVESFINEPKTFEDLRDVWSYEGWGEVFEDILCEYFNK